MSYADGLLATVDLGSNSFRLLIAQIREDGSLHPIDQIKEIVRLTGGLDENEKLSPEKQAAALAVLARFSERLAGFEKNQVRVVGTSALRVAKNAEDFIVIANKTLGFDIEVISGTEEARLIYIGAMHSMSFTMDKRLVIDIGGGSTEFVTGVGYEPEIMESVTMGCVSFSNRYFTGGELNESNFANAIFAARSRVQAMGYLFASHDWSTVVGTSGTARALYDLCIENGFSDQISLDGLYKLRKLLIRHKNINNLPIVG
ncbi:MAG: exopolyphosphatase, partial [Burkholderiales bacterium]|nr:exopolyphosphatase [Burkholderiales bacterium]